VSRRTIATALVALVAIAPSLLAPSGAAAHRDVARGGCGPTSFTRATLPPLGAGTGELYGVEAITGTAVWAVGARFDPAVQVTVPYALRWDGTGWIEVAVPAPTFSQGTALLAVSGSSSNDVWAVGTKTLPNHLTRTFAVHWDGSTWTAVPTPNAGSPKTGVLSGVVALAPDDAWAVGGTSGQGGPERTLILHWGGSAWSVVPSPNKGPWPNGLGDVDAVSASDVWAVGSWFTKAFLDRSLTIHWDGTTWHRVPSPSPGTREVRLSGVSAVSATEVWAVGARGLRTLAERWDGSAWSVVPTPTPGGNAGLSDVLALGAGLVWAAGSRVDGGQHRLESMVQRWDGSTWSPVTTQHVGTSDNGLAAIDGVATHQWAVGYRFASNGLRVLPLMLERCA
jgi:hypothetical protein